MEECPYCGSEIDVGEDPECLCGATWQDYQWLPPRDLMDVPWRDEDTARDSLPDDPSRAGWEDE